MSSTSNLRVAAAVVAAASIGLQIFIPLTWPDLDQRIGTSAIALCVAGLLVAAALAFAARQRSRGPIRRWTVAGFGQGWIEVRVRNNEGAEAVVASNPGDTADRISLRVAFPERKVIKRADVVELVAEIDGEPFEWDIPDTGGRNFEINTCLWRDVGAMKRMVAGMRRGQEFKVVIKELNLQTTFTLDGAFETLVEVETLGDQVATAATNV